MDTNDVISRLTSIQNKLYGDKKLDDIFDISFVYSQLERFCNDVDTAVLVQGLNIFHDSVILMKDCKSEVFDSQMALIIRSVVRCLDVTRDEVSSMAEALLLDISDNANFAPLLKNEIRRSRSNETHTLTTLASYDRIMYNIDPSLETPRSTLGENFNSNLSRINLASDCQSLEAGGAVGSGLLDISFLPQSTTEQWLLARSPEEVSTILDEVCQLYLSLQPARRTRCASDVPKLLKQTIYSMKLDQLAVTMNGLRLLETLVEEHANEFIPDLGAIFPRIQRYMDDPRVAVRHHALRLGGALVVRVPFSTTGRFVFASIEYKPSHPEISLRCASLALLCVQPSLSTVNPLISRIVLIAGEYLGAPSVVASDAKPTMPSTSVQEAAKDLVAIALMILCFSGSQEAGDGSGIEELLPRKLCSIVGIPPTYSVSEQICQRALQSSFPSLESDSNTASLAALAMESSLKEDTCPSSRRGSIAINSTLSEDRGRSVVGKLSSASDRDDGTERHHESDSIMPSLSQDRSEFHHDKRRGEVPSGMSIQIPSSPVVHPRLPTTSENDATTEDYGVPFDSYRPSWTPSDSEAGGFSSLASPWGCTRNRVENDENNELDKSKLRSIKRGGRKPGSRLRARTADETSQSDEWGAGTLQNVPATAFGRIGGNSEGDMPSEELKTPVRASNPDPTVGSKTPIEIGLYTNDGKREHRLEGRTRALLPPRSMATHANRKSKHTLDSNNPGPDSYMSLRVGGNDSDSDTMLSADEGDRDLRRRQSIVPPSLSHTKLGIGMDKEEMKDEMVVGKAYNLDQNDLDNSEMEFGTSDTKVHNARSQLPKRKSKMPHSGSSINRGNGFEICGSSVFNTSADTTEGESTPPIAPVPPRRTRPPVRKEVNINCDEESISSQKNSVDNTTKSEDTGIVATQETFDYLTTDQLVPCEKPKREINKVVSGLAKHEWPDIFHTLNTARQLAAFHGNDLQTSGQLHTIVLGIIKQVENLRSAAAKNAILALGDLFLGLKTGMDAEVSAAAAMLIKRIADSSVFISESVDGTLTTMIKNVSPSRSLAALLPGIENRNSAIRGQVVRMLVILFENRTMELNNPKDLEALFAKLPKMLGDTSPESRSFGRELVRLLLTSRLANRKHMEELLSEEIVTKSMRQSGDYITSRFLSQTRSPGGNRSCSPASRYASPNKTKRGAHQLHNGMGGSLSTTRVVPHEREGSDCDKPAEELVVSGMSPRAGSNSVGGVASQGRHERGRNGEVQGRTLTKLQQESYPEIVALSGIFIGLSSKNWSERRDSLSTLCDSMLRNQELFSKAGQLQKCMERMLERFEDGSVKVVLHAVSCVRRAHNQCPDILPKMLLTSLPAILNVESSANKQIAKEGGALLMALLSVAPSTAVAQQLVGIALHDKDRIRAAAFRAMSSYVYILVEREKRNEAPSGTVALTMKRTFFPVVCQMLCSNSSKPEIKSSAADTLRAIQNNSNEYIGDWAESSVHREELMRLLS